MMVLKISIIIHFIQKFLLPEQATKKGAILVTVVLQVILEILGDINPNKATKGFLKIKLFSTFCLQSW